MGTLKDLLQRASCAFANSLKKIFGSNSTEELSRGFEKLLIEADFGSQGTKAFLAKLPFKAGKEACLEKLRALTLEALSSCHKDLQLDRPSTIMLCGANGNGKTTTIGKLALLYKDRKVLVTNCDTFRAAASEQLSAIVQKAGAELYIPKSKDPAGIAYAAAEEAESYGMLLVDTSGRMSNNENLMQELSKIKRSLIKAAPERNLLVMLVLDASTGQAACKQAEVFANVAQIDGLILTKLDGSAKAGTIVGLAAKYKLPVCFVGTGEGLDSIAHFDPEEFITGLFGDVYSTFGF